MLTYVGVPIGRDVSGSWGWLKALLSERVAAASKCRSQIRRAPGMLNAKSLFFGGRLVSANEALDKVVPLRLVCPRCDELVHLVRRSGSPYFAHWPRTPESPTCGSRTATNGGGGGSRGPSRDEWRRESEAFRRALLEAHRLAVPDPLPQEMRAMLHRVARCLHRSWAVGQGTMPADAEEIVRSHLSSDVVGAPRRDQQVETVLALWRHFHLPQVEDDFVFLIRVGEALKARGDFDGGTDEERKNRSADLAEAVLGPALKSLTKVPWAEQTRATWVETSRLDEVDKCSKCNREVCGSSLEKCYECGAGCCSSCRRECGECGEVLCRSCGMTCPGCKKPTCSDCSNECDRCEVEYCESCTAECLCCRVCNKCGIRCAGCGEMACSDCVRECDSTCGRKFCSECPIDNLATCVDCGAEVCKECSREIPFIGERLCKDCFPLASAAAKAAAVEAEGSA